MKDLLSEKIKNYLIEEIPTLKIVSNIADEIGVKVFIVGGFVRDLLLNYPNYNVNNSDIDIVCLGSGIFLADRVASSINVSNFAVYKNFGTAMFKKDGFKFEFVGARKESYNINSRNPKVEEGSFEDDQLRRDFTINTLAICLNKHNFGEIINFLNGKEDLNNKIIKTPVDPNTTFKDDPLRMLRAIRFATQLDGFCIEKKTFNAIVEQKERIKIISKERIRDEINKILMSKKPSIGFNLLHKSGLLGIIMPYIENLKSDDDCENFSQNFSHKDIFLHTLQVVDNISEKTNNIWLRWAALLHDVAKPFTKKFDPQHGFSFHGHEEIGARWIKKIFNDLCLPKNKIEYVEKLVRLHLRPITIAKNIVTDSAVRRLAFDSGDDFEDLMMLCRADITSHNTKKKEEYFKNFDNVEKKIAEIEKKDKIRNFQPKINGDMIMEIFKIKPGPLVGELKKALKNAILNGEVSNEYEQLHSFLINYLKTIH